MARDVSAAYDAYSSGNCPGFAPGSLLSLRPADEGKPPQGQRSAESGAIQSPRHRSFQHFVKDSARLPPHCAIFAPQTTIRHHDPENILHLPGNLLPANRHRTRRRDDPQRRLHGRLPRQYAGHRGARQRHAGRRGHRTARRHRLPRQGNLVPRSVGPRAENGALTRRTRTAARNRRRVRILHSVFMSSKNERLCISYGICLSGWRPDGSPTCWSRAAARALSSI